jgi:hypothetical protein
MACATGVFEMEAYGAKNGTTLPYIVYKSWEVSYRLLRARIRELELYVHGASPRGIRTVRRPFKKSITKVSPSECYQSTFAGATPDMVPLYRLVPSGMDTAATVKIKNDPTSENVLNNFWLSSEVSERLTEPRVLAGYLQCMRDGCPVNTSIGAPLDKFLYDIPSDQLSLVELPEAREGMINYLQYLARHDPNPRSWSTTSRKPLLSYAEWSTQNGLSAFDPTHLGQGLDYYYTSLAPSVDPSIDPRAGFQCANKQSPMSETCLMLEHVAFDLTSAMTGPVPIEQLPTLKGRPRNWEYTLQVHVPLGRVAEVQRAGCPTNFTVQSADPSIGGHAVLTMTNPNTLNPITFSFSASSTSDATCGMANSQASLNPGATEPIIVPLCGANTVITIERPSDHFVCWTWNGTLSDSRVSTPAYQVEKIFNEIEDQNAFILHDVAIQAAATLGEMATAFAQHVVPITPYSTDQFLDDARRQLQAKIDAMRESNAQQINISKALRDKDWALVAEAAAKTAADAKKLADQAQIVPDALASIGARIEAISNLNKRARQAVEYARINQQEYVRATQNFSAAVTALTTIFEHYDWETADPSAFNCMYNLTILLQETKGDIDVLTSAVESRINAKKDYTSECTVVSSNPFSWLNFMCGPWLAQVRFLMWMVIWALVFGLPTVAIWRWFACCCRSESNICSRLAAWAGSPDTVGSIALTFEQYEQQKKGVVYTQMPVSASGLRY